MMHWFYWPKGYYWNGWGWWPGLLMWLIPAGLIVLFLFALLRRPSHETGQYQNTRAIDILKERYARGEVTEEEYRHILKNLRL